MADIKYLIQETAKQKLTESLIPLRKMQKLYNDYEDAINDGDSDKVYFNIFSIEDACAPIAKTFSSLFGTKEYKILVGRDAENKNWGMGPGDMAVIIFKRVEEIDSNSLSNIMKSNRKILNPTIYLDGKGEVAIYVSI
jgi:hypothetical protein